MRLPLLILAVVVAFACVYAVGQVAGDPEPAPAPAPPARIADVPDSGAVSLGPPPALPSDIVKRRPKPSPRKPSSPATPSAPAVAPATPEPDSQPAPREEPAPEPPQRSPQREPSPEPAPPPGIPFSDVE